MDRKKMLPKIANKRMEIINHMVGLGKSESSCTGDNTYVTFKNKKWKQEIESLGISNVL